MSAGTSGKGTADAHWRQYGLIAAAIVPLALLFSRPPLAQDPAYHVLADTRVFLGIPNFGDVASNVAFLLVGIAGLRLCRAGDGTGAVRSWTVFFLGVALVFLGSGWYHWSPDDASLVWDRLPMTVAFMGLLVAVVTEHAESRFERALLVPAVAVGIASVAGWVWTGDLRAYLWVQAAPLICVLYVLIAYRGRYTHRLYLAAAFVAYALAKGAEFRDQQIYELTAHAVSGHTLKHLLAALGIFFIYLMLSRRKPIPGKVPVERG